MTDQYGATEVTIRFRTNNAAFTDGQGPDEVARILRELADTVESDGSAESSGFLYDINGNRVGNYDIELPTDEDDEDEDEDDDEDEDEDDDQDDDCECGRKADDCATADGNPEHKDR